MVRHRSKCFSALLCCLLILLSGCIDTNYQGASYPAAASAMILENDPQVLKNYRIIGRGTASGEFSGVSNQELREKLRELGEAHGAEALVIVGSRIVPEGKAADPAEENFILATDDPDQAATERTFYEDISENHNHAGITCKRIMYALFLRKK